MTKQEMRQITQRNRKRERLEAEENEMLSRVKERQRSILNDPTRAKWNKYHCWNYRTVDGIEEDIRAGFEFIVDGGIIFATKNPLLSEGEVRGSVKS